MPEADDTILSTDEYRVDYFRAAEPSGRLMITFTEVGDHRLEGPGFAGEFALKRHFDLIAVKSKPDDWYQSLPADSFTQIEKFLRDQPHRHAWRAAYGASMGGYAAIMFAREVRADVVLALSPQFDITRHWDTRWAGQGARIGTMRTLQRPQVQPGCRYVIAYDPANPDRLHFEKFQEIIPPDQLQPVRVRYSGHPVAYVLSAVGHLKGLAEGVLSGQSVPSTYSFRQQRHLLPEYFVNLADHCYSRRKHRWAKSIMERAIDLDRLNPEYHTRAAKFTEASGDLDGAISHAAIAVALEPENPFMAELLARYLHARGLNAQALHQIDAALALLPDEAYFLRQRARMLEALDQPR